jgi:CheY-like chemotaxis protein
MVVIPATERIPAERTERPTVLLVDDDTSFRARVYEYLEERGYDVLAAGNDADALTICWQFRHEISLRLTDIHMPGMTGFEWAANAARLRPLMRVLFMSGGLASNENARDQRRPLLKPFNEAMLMETVAHALWC